MRKITLLLALIATSLGFSQTYDLLTNGDFENDTAPWVGDNFTVVGGEAFISTTNAGGDPWSTQLVHGSLEFENGKEYVLTFYARAAANRQITVAIQNVGIWNDQFRQENIDITTTMTEYTYTFNATSDNANVQIGFLMAGFGSTDAIYYDDISLVTAGTAPETCNDGILNNGETEIDCGGPNCTACPNPPTTPPTTPPNRDAANVVSIYGNSYTQAATDGYQTFGGAVVSEIDLSGNTILSVTTPDNGSGLQYQYFNVSPQYLDLSAMSNTHIDFYFEGTITDGDTVLLVIAQYSDGTNIQKTYNLNTLASNTWHEMDVAFADFDLNATNARDEIQQVIVQVAGPQGSLVGPFYFDNLYFHNNMVLSTDEFETASFRAFPNPTSDAWNISGNSIINNVAVYDILGKQVIALIPNTNEAVIDASSLNSGIYFARIEGVNGSKTVKLIKE